MFSEDCVKKLHCVKQMQRSVKGFYTGFETGAKEAPI